jgi:hypothetical protein
MSKYRMYIDEVGNPDLESSENPNHRFLSLTGVIIDLDHVNKTVHPEMESLKRKYFGSHPDDPIILHRKELVNKQPPFEVLLDAKICEQFDKELLNLLVSWEYRICTVCIDKKRHKETYTTWRYDPYHYCLAVLLERFVFFLKHQQAHGDVMAESRGSKEDMRLKASYSRLWDYGTEYVEPKEFKETLTSKELKVRPKSANVAGLQLADLLAHPSRSEILSEQGFFDRELAPFSKKIISILANKYHQEIGRIYGKKFI